MPILLNSGEILGQEFPFGNNRNVRKYEVEVLRKGQWMVFRAEDAGYFDGQHVSPVGVVEEKEKISVIYELTFKGRRRGARG